MHSLTQHASLTLEPGSALRLGRVRGARIRIAQGQVWLTEAGQLEDNVLSQGDEYVAHSSGAVVVEALSAARIYIERDVHVWSIAKQFAWSLWSTLPRWTRAHITHMHLGRTLRAH